MRRLLVAVWLVLLLALPVAAQRPDAPFYAKRGAYAVGTRELKIEDAERPLNITIWYPAEGKAGSEPVHNYTLLLTFAVPGHAYLDAPVAASDAPYPVIVFSHGSGGSRLLSLFYTEHLASHGFIVIAADHPGNNVANSVGVGGFLGASQDFAQNYALRPDDVLRQLDLAEQLNAEGDFAGALDLDNIGVTGHSFGGWTALAVGGARFNLATLADWCDANPTASNRNVCFITALADDIATARGLDAAPVGVWDATQDERIKAIVALAPWNAPSLNFEQVSAPTLIIVGSSDLVTTPERDALAAYASLTAPKALLTLAYAGHYIFIDECPAVLLNVGIFDQCSDLVWDMPRAHDLTNHAATAFFLAQLKQDSAALRAFANINATGVTFEQAMP